MMASHLEIERKYETGVGFALPDLRDVPGLSAVAEPTTHTLVARYYDTEDLRLAARGITLRRRTGGHDAGWHLKLPVGRGAKQEVHAPLFPGPDTVPERLSDLVAAYTRGRELLPIAQLETRRTERALLAADGTVLAELADDNVTAQRLGPRPDGSGWKTWREIEVELVDGPPEVVKAVGKRLRGSGARKSRAAAKLEVVLGDELAPVERPAATGTAGEAMTAYLAGQAEQLLAHDPLVRLADHDDDSVHKMRVSVRRIRSILRTHRRLLDRARVEPLDTELKWLADALGEVRDLEVLRARYTGQLTDVLEVPREPAPVARLAREESAARDRLRKTLLTPRYRALLDALDAFIADPPVTERAHRGAGEELSRVVTRSWRKMARAHDEADRLPAGRNRDGALHATRKAAKRARYTAEAATAVLGRPARRLAKGAERIQGVLGAYQDGVVARQHLAGLASRPDTAPDDAFVIGELAGVQRCAGVRALDDLPAVWKKANSRKLLRAL
ncbi:CHAD domain-containing protein [Actinomadura scrupuli]|uniref:CYTH and CHAD domain-containing protein n=1 Tax=Actinomadura scrupuli TaxID=559629 RepID=UPI003D95AE32